MAVAETKSDYVRTRPKIENASLPFTSVFIS